MAFDIGAILGRLVLDNSKWDSAIKSAKADLKSFEGAILRNEGRVKKFGLAMGVAGAAITATNVKLVTMAATAEESENLFEVSMGNMADAARKWSEELSDSLGLNEFELRRTIGTLNVMLKSMGLSEDAAYGMSSSLVQLSHDMASFFNLSPDEAFQKIQSGITGEVEPLKRLGIIVNETTIKNFALTNGIIKQGEAMTEQQKILARYGVIMEATKNAQGDLARTIDSTTNQWRLLTAGVQELSVKIGQNLLPVVNSLISVGVKLVRWLDEMVEKFPTATKVITIFTAALGLLMTVAGAILIALPGLAAAATAMGVSLVAAAGIAAASMIGLAAAIAAVILVATNFEFVKALAFSFADGMNYSVGQIVNGLATIVEALAKIPGPTKKMFQGVAESLRDFAEDSFRIADEMQSKAQQALTESATRGEQLREQVRLNTEGMQSDFKGMWDGFVNESQQAYLKVDKQTKNWFVRMKEEFNMFEEAGRRTFNSTSDAFSDLFVRAIEGDLDSLEEVFASFGQSVVKIIADIIAQWLTMQIITGIAGIFAPTPSLGGAAKGIGGFGGMSIGSLGANTGMASAGAGALSAIPSFDKGSDFIPHDMIAQVHKGEKILTPEEAREDSRESNTPINITNVITPEAIAMAMNSHEGRNTIINIINRDSILGGTSRKVVQRR